MYRRKKGGIVEGGEGNMQVEMRKIWKEEDERSNEKRGGTWEGSRAAEYRL